LKVFLGMFRGGQGISSCLIGFWEGLRIYNILGEIFYFGLTQLRGFLKDDEQDHHGDVVVEATTMVSQAAVMA